MNELSPATQSPSRTARWWHRYTRVATISTQLGRLPRRSDPEIASADIAWLANQRRTHHLTEEQRLALTALPGWSDNPRAEQWLTRAEELREFIHVNGRAPRVGGRLPGESALAHWFSRQRVALRNGELSRARATALAYATRHLR